MAFTFTTVTLVGPGTVSPQYLSVCDNVLGKPAVSRDTAVPTTDPPCFLTYTFVIFRTCVSLVIPTFERPKQEEPSLGLHIKTLSPKQPPPPKEILSWKPCKILPKTNHLQSPQFCI